MCNLKKAPQIQIRAKTFLIAVIQETKLSKCICNERNNLQSPMASYQKLSLLDAYGIQVFWIAN